MNKAWTVERLAPDHVDISAWQTITHDAPPEADLGWLRFLNSPASGYHHSIQVIAAWDGAQLLGALVFSEAGRPLFSNGPVDQAWRELSVGQPTAKGLRCWLPLSIYSGILCPDHPERQLVFTSLVEYLIAFARQSGYHFLSVPGVFAQDEVLRGVLCSYGLASLAGARVAVLDMHGPTIDAFIQSLKQRYRNQFRTYRSQLFERAGVIVSRKQLSVDEAAQCLQLHQATARRHSDQPLVTAQFLQAIGPDQGVTSEFLILRQDGCICAFLMMLLGQQSFAAKFYGARYEADCQALYPYWNMIFAAIELGLERGDRYGFFGSTAYDEKQHLGCHLLETSDHFLPLSRQFITALRQSQADQG